MKFRVDGPTADELASLQHQSGLSVPTHLALEVQRQFRDLFGGKDFSKNASSSSSAQVCRPRRACEKQKKVGSLAHSQRSRELQLSTLTSGKPGASHSKLEAAVAQSKECRHSQKQKTLIQQLQAHASKKRRLILEDALPADENNPMMKKYRLWKQAADVKLGALNKLQTRDLSINVVSQQVFSKQGCFVFTSEKLDADGDEARKLNQLGLDFSHWVGESGNYLKAMRCTTLLWYCSSDSFRSVVWPGQALTSLGMNVRLLGGGVVNHEWLRVCFAKNKLFKPALALGRSLDVPQEVCIHKSVRNKEDGRPNDPLCLAIALATNAGRQAGNQSGYQWTVREKWSNV
jgi:hypothetical protein